MSVFTPGTGSDLSSSTIPAALLEMALLTSQAEDAQNIANPNDPAINNTIVTFADDGSISITANLPGSYAIGADGKPVVTATDYLT